ncbi:MAG: uracil-DNA glycosylase, partial [Candidatus Omnitrophica bacterium]|nr:uracil-DNA glycosylase [Candidatus Omnitrophota bacterium]
MAERRELQRAARALRQQLEGWRVWGIKDFPREVPDTASRAAALSRIEQQVKMCTRCPLYRTRTHHVFGEGDPRARLVFVGEAPGRDEDLQGRPFVGAAGQLLTKMIEAMGFRREAVYICNVLKDRPPGNRTPEPAEVEACLPFLEQQLALIRPAVICA